MLKQKLENVDIDSVILNLSLYCPTYCPNSKHTHQCQLGKVQDFTIQQKTEWLKKITQNEKLSIILKHESCFEKNR